MSDVIHLPLSKGYTAIIDVEDAHLAAFKWCAAVRSTTVYAQRAERIDGRRGITLLHQAVIGRAPKGMVIDHEDGDGLNCRRGNLRHVTQGVNVANSDKVWGHGSNAIRGVYRHDNGSWVALLSKRYLGSYKTQNEALAARLAAEAERYGIQPRREHRYAD